MMFLLYSKKIIYYTFCTALFFSVNKTLKCAEPEKIIKDKVMCVTIPKSGTHLLLKCLTLIGAKEIAYEYWKNPRVRYFNNLKEPVPTNLKKAFSNPHKKAFERHLPHTPESEKFITDRTFANFFMLRDPRAQLISQAKTFQKARIGGMKKSIEDFALDMLLARKQNFLPLREHLIYKNLPSHIVISMADLFIKLGFAEFYKLFMPWTKAKNFYSVRFEKLVGDQGHGSRKEQEQEIRNIAQHMKIKLSDEKLNKITEELFGGTGTFREGQIDSWKKYFTPTIKAAFKSQPYLMQLLIELGYEKNTDW